MMNLSELTKDAVLRIGEVSEVAGRKVYITVDKNKNLSEIFFDGDILKNISVNSFVEIKKGYLSIIGRVDGERIEEEYGKTRPYDEINKNRRVLAVSLSGYIDRDGRFVGGTRELPLIGNEAYIVTKEKIHRIHNLLGTGTLSINIAMTDSDDIEIGFPIDGLFNSHIAVFGNTGSGKSNTLAYLYQEFFKIMHTRNPAEFKQRSHFVLFDFNGEYTGEACITDQKNVLNLSTRTTTGDKIPIDERSLLDIEIISILSDATDKTQKPFLKRALSLYKHIFEADDPLSYFKNMIKKELSRVLQMSDKIRAFQLLDYFREVLPPPVDGDGVEFDIADDLDWNNTNEGFTVRNERNVYLNTQTDRILSTRAYLQADQLEFDDNLLNRIIKFLYLQLIKDVLSNRAQNEHIAPVINKLKSKMHDIEKIFDVTGGENFWIKNLVVVNLSDVNIEMKKTVPLLLAKKVYAEQKRDCTGKTLTIIIDEAHNILSRNSSREEESWKDYRLETFEEIIKEGRKFGVFVTIASQRPNDISGTITSQAHNYFIHRLINQKDLDTIASAVSYIDRITEASIPALPTGTCVFSGVASQMPLKINIKELADDLKPKSQTVQFEKVVPAQRTDV